VVVVLQSRLEGSAPTPDRFLIATQVETGHPPSDRKHSSAALSNRYTPRSLAAAFCFTSLLLAALAIPIATRADEPYARSRTYDLQHLTTHLWFDVDHRKIRGEVTESVAALRDNLAELRFDSVDLKIESVTVDGKPAKFSTTPTELVVSLDEPAARGEHHEVFIRYAGQPRQGLYFVLPDKNYPQQPVEIWTQGEAEDTRYYIPVYDYPNDRTTSEMLLTVPASWITVSNGQLLEIQDERDGTKTWRWQQSEPLSTYLISVVAGEFVERVESWHGVPVRYVVPRGRESTIDSTFARTRDMLELFSRRLGVPYPWPQYAQTSVDDFVAGGMENTSATTLSTHDLVSPALAREQRTGDDTVTSHELAHQWFGDLVTCKDWGNLWLNEGFATFLEHFWMERHYGADDAAYEYWREQSRWFAQKRLYPVPILNRKFKDSTEYAGNIYTKAAWVLRMLREELGDDDFFRGLHHYLEVNRGQNVVTADLQKAIEQATSVNVDKFFHQWVYRAGAPQFEVSYAYDAQAREVKLDVKQTQTVEGLVGLFDVPIEVEIATASGSRSYPIEISEASRSFTLPADGAPLMVIFDKGDRTLKSVDFKKDPALWIYQLKNAETVPDRADAAVALGNIRNNSDAVAALTDAALHDPFWGVRVEALRALGRIGGPEAEKTILTAASAASGDQPWVRDVAVSELGQFKSDSSLASKLTDIAANDGAYRVRAAALRTLAAIKAPNAYGTLAAALQSDSPDDILRRAALTALGALGDDRAVPALLEWSAPGKPLRDRRVAIGSVARLDKKNKEITRTLIACLYEPYLDVRQSAILAIWLRRDPDAIAPLEELTKSGGLSIGERPHVEAALAALKEQGRTK
jgi:aminopeptidase N